MVQFNLFAVFLTLLFSVLNPIKAQNTLGILNKPIKIDYFPKIEEPPINKNLVAVSQTDFCKEDFKHNGFLVQFKDLNLDDFVEKIQYLKNVIGFDDFSLEKTFSEDFFKANDSPFVANLLDLGFDRLYLLKINQQLDCGEYNTIYEKLQQADQIERMDINYLNTLIVKY